MGGNGREPRRCASVCARLSPRKTRPERLRDLISARRHGRKLVPLGWGGGGGCRAVWARLNVLPRQRERDAEQEQSSSLLFATQPATAATLAGVGGWRVLTCAARHRICSRPRVRDADLPSSRLAGVGSVQSAVICIWIVAALPESRRDRYYSAHVQRISHGCTAFADFFSFSFFFNLFVTQPPSNTPRHVRTAALIVFVTRLCFYCFQPALQ